MAYIVVGSKFPDLEILGERRTYPDLDTIVEKGDDFLEVPGVASESDIHIYSLIYVGTLQQTKHIKERKKEHESKIEDRLNSK